MYSLGSKGDQRFCIQLTVYFGLFFLYFVSVCVYRCVASMNWRYSINLPPVHRGTSEERKTIMSL